MKDFMEDINSPSVPVKNDSSPTEVSTTDSYSNQRSSGMYGYGRSVEQTKGVPAAESTYDIPDFESSERSIMMDILKVTLGALVGAIPGMLLWIIIGKTGFVCSACGFLLAAGIVFGYTFMTKDDNIIPLSWGVVICLVIMVSAIYFATKIVWTWELVDQFNDSVAAAKERLRTMADLWDYADYDSVGMERMLDDNLKATFGFSDGTFGNCWSNFSKVMDVCGTKSDFNADLLMSYLFAALGGGSLFYKFARKR